MVAESNQNVFLIQIDVSSFSEFEISEFEVSRVNCMFFSFTDPGCKDHWNQCRLVVQARLCPYKYYKEKCCHSCTLHHLKHKRDKEARQHTNS